MPRTIADEDAPMPESPAKAAAATEAAPATTDDGPPGSGGPDKHGSVPEGGLDCGICWDDIETENYVEYQKVEGGEWFPAKLCMNCAKEYRSKQYEIYRTALTKVTCEAEQKRLLDTPPPLNLKETNVMPMPEGSSGEIAGLWFSSEGVVTAKLDGALEGEERMKFWEEQKQFRPWVDEAAGEGEGEGTGDGAAEGDASGEGSAAAADTTTAATTTTES